MATFFGNLVKASTQDLARTHNLKLKITQTDDALKQDPRSFSDDVWAKISDNGKSFSFDDEPCDNTKIMVADFFKRLYRYVTTQTLIFGRGYFLSDSAIKTLGADSSSPLEKHAVTCGIGVKDYAYALVYKGRCSSSHKTILTLNPSRFEHYQATKTRYIIIKALPKSVSSLSSVLERLEYEANLYADYLNGCVYDLTLTDKDNNVIDKVSAVYNTDGRAVNDYFMDMIELYIECR